MTKYELKKSTEEIAYEERERIVPGCTANVDPVVIKSFTEKEDALKELGKYKSEVNKLSGNSGTYFNVTEYYVEIGEYDEDGDWINGGDIIEFSKGLPIVINPYGVIFDADVSDQYMDSEIKEILHNRIAPCSAQKFFDAYSEEHENKFGEEWELVKENPVL